MEAAVENAAALLFHAQVSPKQAVKRGTKQQTGELYVQKAAKLPPARRRLHLDRVDDRRDDHSASASVAVPNLLELISKPSVM